MEEKIKKDLDLCGIDLSKHEPKIVEKSIYLDSHFTYEKILTLHEGGYFEAGIEDCYGDFMPYVEYIFKELETEKEMALRLIREVEKENRKQYNNRKRDREIIARAKKLGMEFKDV